MCVVPVAITRGRDQLLYRIGERLIVFYKGKRRVHGIKEEKEKVRESWDTPTKNGR